ncbi:MAG TPA: TlpA disulfide reductase family protein [Solirubrobacterales bacterium]|nr:TlpA disulfide reductase family protein [Solirubrobacterales bacterium]
MNDHGGPDRQRPAARPGRAYSVVVGLAFVGLILVAAINTLRTSEGGVLGSGGERGTALAQFAVPEARGPVEGDANVYQDDCESSALPCPADDRRTPACEVSGPNVDSGDIIRVCDLFDRPLVISFWFTRGGDCLPTQDVVDDVASRYRGRVNFLSINVRDDRETVRGVIEERGWRIPVGHDVDGAVSNIYRVGVCPTVAFAYPGGILEGAVVGSEELGEEALTADVEALIRESRRRAETDR